MQPDQLQENKIGIFQLKHITCYRNKVESIISLENLTSSKVFLTTDVSTI